MLLVCTVGLCVVVSRWLITDCWVWRVTWRELLDKWIWVNGLQWCKQHYSKISRLRWRPRTRDQDRDQGQDLELVGAHSVDSDCAPTQKYSGWVLNTETFIAQKVAIFAEKNNKIPSLMFCQRSDLRKTMKHSQNRDLEGILWILRIYTDAAPVVFCRKFTNNCWRKSSQGLTSMRRPTQLLKTTFLVSRLV